MDGSPEWTWDNEHMSEAVVLSENNLEVKFHDEYSWGTSVVRGNKLMEKGRHHYWEIEMISPVYGTDVMIGVGTSKVNLNNVEDIFCSLLGNDHESFGFSYQGYIQHGGEKRSYSAGFGQGSIVGIHLDTWKGTLEYFLNRKPLGIAFIGLRDCMLYPMACSTAAHSKMRLVQSCSVPVSLQTECLAMLKPVQKQYLSTVIPGLRYLIQSIFADILHNELDDAGSANDVTLDNCDYASCYAINFAKETVKSILVDTMTVTEDDSS